MRYTKLKLVAAVALLIAGLSVAYAALPTREPPPPGGQPAPVTRPAEPPANAAEKPMDERLKPMQGKWRKVEENTPDGDKAEPFRRVNQLAHTLVTIDKDKMVTKDIQGAILVGPDGEQSFLPLTEEIRFPAGDNPQAIDLVITDGLGGFEGTTRPAIYKQDGDRLTICVRDLDHVKKGRPTKFKTDETQAVIVLEVVKMENEELKMFGGEWKGTKLVFLPERTKEVGKGKEAVVVLLPEEVVADKKAKPKWVIADRTVRFEGTGEPGEKATIKLNPAATPPAIDMTVTDVDGKETKLSGIYWRRGDKLTVCFGAKGGPRPTELRTGEDVLFYVLEQTFEK